MMLGIDYNKLEEMVSRMEMVSASMEESSKRVLLASEKMAATLDTKEVVVSKTDVFIDGSAVKQAALAEMDRARTRK